jgi:hypothetical protein
MIKPNKDVLPNVAVYLHLADNYHRFIWPTFTGAKRPR